PVTRPPEPKPLEGKPEEEPGPEEVTPKEDEQRERRLTIRDEMELNVEVRERLEVETRNVYDEYYSEIAPFIEMLFGILDNELVKDKKFRYKGYHSTGPKMDLRKAMTMKKTGDMDIWLRRIKPTKRSFKFSLVLDESGSMGGGKSKTSKDAIKALVLFMEVLSRLDIDFSLIGFSSGPSTHKYLGEQFKHKDKNALLSEVLAYLERGGCTYDAAAVNLAIKQLEPETTDSKVILVITDGYGNGPVEVEKLIREARKKGIEVIGIGVGNGMAYVKSVYHPHAVVETMDQLPRVIAKILIDIIVFKKYTTVDYEEESDSGSASRTRFISTLKRVRQKKRSYRRSKETPSSTAKSLVRTSTAEEKKPLIAQGSAVSAHTILLGIQRGDAITPETLAYLKDAFIGVDINVVPLPKDDAAGAMEDMVREREEEGKEVVGVVAQDVSDLTRDELKDMLTPSAIYLLSGKKQKVHELIYAVEEEDIARIKEIVDKEDALSIEELRRLLFVITNLLAPLEPMDDIDWEGTLNDIQAKLDQDIAFATVMPSRLPEEAPEERINVLMDKLERNRSEDGKPRNFLVVTDKDRKSYVDEVSKRLNRDIEDIFHVVTYRDIEKEIGQKAIHDNPVEAVDRFVRSQIEEELGIAPYYIGGEDLFEDEIDRAWLINGLLNGIPEAIDVAYSLIGKDASRLTLERLRKNVIDMAPYIKELQRQRRADRETQLAL
ncbi:VWA domain-containing protein, partial [Omnitrophica bacterium]|nr:VWA domain-containing protein [Candidatus Omnitrophota bacterium]